LWRPVLRNGSLTYLSHPAPGNHQSSFINLSGRSHSEDRFIISPYFPFCKTPLRNDRILSVSWSLTGSSSNSSISIQQFPLTFNLHMSLEDANLMWYGVPAHMASTKYYLSFLLNGGRSCGLHTANRPSYLHNALKPQRWDAGKPPRVDRFTSDQDQRLSRVMASGVPRIHRACPTITAPDSRVSRRRRFVTISCFRAETIRRTT